MTETNSEKLANTLQLMFFIVDALKDGVKIEENIISKAEKSLPKIQSLLKDIDKEHYSCNDKAISFGRFLLGEIYLKKTFDVDRMFEEWQELTEI